jgi:hypothetical protein
MDMQTLPQVHKAFDKHKCTHDACYTEGIRPQDVHLALWDLGINALSCDISAAVTGSEIIDLEAFKAFYLEFADTAANPQRACAMFAKLDGDRDGLLSVADAREHLNGCGEEALTDREFDDFWASVSQRSAAHADVSAAEFVRTVCPKTDVTEVRSLVAIYYSANVVGIAATSAALRGCRVTRRRSSSTALRKAALAITEKPQPEVAPVESPVDLQLAEVAAEDTPVAATRSATPQRELADEPVVVLSPSPVKQAPVAVAPVAPLRKAQDGGCCVIC